MTQIKTLPGEAQQGPDHYHKRKHEHGHFFVCNFEKVSMVSMKAIFGLLPIYCAGMPFIGYKGVLIYCHYHRVTSLDGTANLGIARC